VLRASSDAGVKRVVLTSSFAAVGYEHQRPTAPFDETNWTNPSADVSAYVKSKTFAERAAWDFVASHHGLERSVVNPVGVRGPVLGPDAVNASSPSPVISCRCVKRLLGWRLRSSEAAIVATAESLVRLGLLKI
jgi:nucleoside-diphosphate-sugar epimerase